jgi:heme/copper-type cytochrome/quinol oxidase subunit 3
MAVIDLPDVPHAEEHGDHAGDHAFAPEFKDGYQRFGIYLFIVGDAVIVGSLLFTYLYLRGLNIQKQWMPNGVHTVSAALNWGIAACVVLSAIAVWFSESALKRRSGGFSAFAFLAVAIALVGAVLQVIFMRDIPQATNSVSGVVQVHGAYASAMLAIGGSNLAHLVVLAFLGIGLLIRAARGRVTSDKWYQARLVRIFWVWVATATVITAACTTIFSSSPRI